jgi:thiamine-phosphate pyrophosphorylase
LGILQLAEAAVAARVDLLQLREKNLNARVLYELSRQVAELAQGSVTRVLVNDRADIARAAGANGVHLTTASLEASVIRRAFGAEFLIGVSTHSAEDVRAARHQGADFVVFGPVFETESKRAYGEPLGLEMVKKVTAQLESFPVLAIGGVTIERVASCFRAGATGIAAIRLLNDPANLAGVVDQVHSKFEERRK